MPICPRCKSFYAGQGKVCPNCQGRPHLATAGAGRTAETQPLPSPGAPPGQPIDPRRTPASGSTGPSAGRLPHTGETNQHTPLLTRREEAQQPAGAASSTGEIVDLEGIEPLIGQTPLGQYRILKKLGEGGFGSVYLADQLGVNRKAVIKVLHRKLVESDVFVKRFEREAAVLAALDNQHLVRLYNFGELGDGQLFLAMEYGGDTTVADEIKKRGRLEPDRALLIAEHVAEALEEAHEQGIIHRDLKPANILLGRKNTADWAKVVDVGIAKILDIDQSRELQLTGSGVIIGTPSYFSPEQGRGLSLDGRSDLYALGIVLYEMLTGTLPIKGVTPMDFVRAHTVDAPIPFSKQGVVLPHYIEGIVFRALEKDPAKRFRSAAEMKRALAKARERMYADTRPKKKKILLGAGAVAAAATISISVWFFNQSATLAIAVTPVAAEIFLDGQRISPGRISVEPGPHTVRAQAKGYKPEAYALKIGRGEVLPVNLALIEEAVAAPQRSAAEPPAPQPPVAAASVGGSAPSVKSHPRPAKEAANAAVTVAPGGAEDALDARASALLFQAQKMVGGGDYKGGIGKAEEAVKLKPSTDLLATAYRALGLYYRHEKKFIRAQLYLELYRPYCPPAEHEQLESLLGEVRAENEK